MSVAKKVAPKKRFAALRAHYKRAAGAAHEHIMFVARDEESWYFMLGRRGADAVGEFVGNADEFRGGQYVGIVTATENYPYEPPLVEMLTPTGVFPVRETKFCISVGQYHPRDYPAVLGMDGYVESIWSGLIGHASLGPGIGLLNCRSAAENIAAIRAAAAASIAYNAEKYPRIVAMFAAKK